MQIIGFSYLTILCECDKGWSEMHILNPYVLRSIRQQDSAEVVSICERVRAIKGYDRFFVISVAQK